MNSYRKKAERYIRLYTKILKPPYSKKSASILSITFLALALPAFLLSQTNNTNSSSNASAINSIEPANGTIAGSVSIVPDASVSGGKYIVFGANPSPTSEPATPTPGSTSTTAVWTNGQGQSSYFGDISKDEYVILYDYEYTEIPTLRSNNPNIKIIAYQETATNDNPQYGCNPPFPHLSTGTDYCYMLANYPNTFLKNAGGTILNYPDYPSYHPMDPSTVSFQDQWQKQVIARIKPDGFDGVMADDANIAGIGHSITQYFHADSTPYNDTQYSNDWVTWSQYVIPRINAAGLSFFGNFACNPWSVCETNIESVSKIPGAGHMREFWMRWDSGNVFTDSTWTSLMHQAETEMANGGKYIAYTDGTLSETAVMRYTRASFLLAWNGVAGSAYTYVNPNTSTADPHNPNWTIEIGTPTETRTQVGVGWIRHYTGGVVVVDPSSTTSQTFSLGGTYTDQDGNVESSITLAPGTGMILHN